MNTITINSGNYKIWDFLDLYLPEKIEFQKDNNYFITGDNGLGKSSFIKKVLIPEILSENNKNILLFYIAQDFNLQFYAIKAYSASRKGEKKKVNTFEDALNYMLDNFLSSIKRETDSIFFIFDEIEVYSKLAGVMKKINNLNKISVTVTHNNDNLENISTEKQINFSKISKNSTKIIQTIKQFKS